AKNARLNGYVQTPNLLTADRQLSDEAYRLWHAGRALTWRAEDHDASNARLAAQCGWFAPSGKPSISKVKRLLRELERLGLCRREVEDVKGQLKRTFIRFLDPEGASGGDGPRMDRGG